MGEGDTTGKQGRGTRPVEAATEVEAPRLFRAASVRELLPAITRPAYRRRSPATAGLVEAWPRIAGTELAAVSAPRRCAGGTLSVACAGPAAMELQHRGEQLIERANRILGPGAVQRLRIVQEPLPPATPQAPKVRPAPAPISLPDLPEGPLRAALERLGGHLVAGTDRSEPRR
ncbi:hypothetical protein FHR90_002443 [Endobacter medicaginis]|uniref:DUF721 domain-containing protein n=1 Tax=Endobacter medicaginis TaxID=1181271 RepID=A0A839UWD3_9PROT|nr:DciA family protein [Endobacter medicaginis]MBB3174598.1 hypothetical protein [Endobacter medicaginis]MCX5474710.1 DciA family protein [Endobacter medicaginis]